MSDYREHWEKFPTRCPACGRMISSGGGVVYLAKCGRFVFPDDKPTPEICIIVGSDPNNETVEFIGRKINQ